MSVRVSESDIEWLVAKMLGSSAGAEPVPVLVPVVGRARICSITCRNESNEINFFIKPEPLWVKAITLLRVETECSCT